VDSLVLVVEGKGEIEAAPALLRRILWELFERFNFSTIRPISSRGRFRLLKQGGLENFLAAAAAVEGCKGILVLLDAENEHRDCPPSLALELSQRAQNVRLQVPVVIVCAVCEYESWFLASMHTIAGKYDIDPSASFSGNAEETCSAKSWITSQMPPGRIYKETIHQVKMTFDLDLDHLSANVRSFQRLLHAVDELLTAIDDGQIIITPQ
jgi:hypothetical protein